MVQPRAFLRSLFEAAIAAADPAHYVPPNLPAPQGRTIVGAGEAAASMARTVEQQWAGDLTGLVVTVLLQL
jgi:glycerate 2-kinase